MARFYGTVEGSRGQASRLGSKTSGLTVEACGEASRLRTRLWVNADTDWATVTLQDIGTGEMTMVYDGPLDKLAIPDFTKDT